MLQVITSDIVSFLYFFCFFFGISLLQVNEKVMKIALPCCLIKLRDNFSDMVCFKLYVSRKEQVLKALDKFVVEDKIAQKH